MELKQFYIPNSLDNFNYILVDDTSKEAIFFDPFDIADSGEWLEKQDCHVAGYLLTHHHFDHVKAVEDLKSRYQVEEIRLKDKESMNLGEVGITAHYTPGHIDPHYMFLLNMNDKKYLVTGDVLFHSGIGNCKNGGDVEVLFETISWMKNYFSDDCYIAPSHDYFIKNLDFAQTIEPSNGQITIYRDKYLKARHEGKYLWTQLKDERKYNPFLRLDSNELKQTLGGKSDKDNFIKLRSLRDRF